MRTLSILFCLLCACDAGPRFQAAGDGTILDRSSGLLWLARPITNREMTWDEATNAAACLVAAGHDDWRLPTIPEITALLDYGSTNQAATLRERGFFAFDGHFWTAALCVPQTNLAWSYDLWYGAVSYVSRDGSYFAFVVRSP